LPPIRRFFEYQDEPQITGMRGMLLTTAIEVKGKKEKVKGMLYQKQKLKPRFRDANAERM
jgi:hypothetical protein